MWVFGSAGDVRVAYDINFETQMDRDLSRVLLLEMNSVKVTNNPAIKYYDKDYPKEVTDTFRGVAN